MGDAVLADAGIRTVLCNVRAPRMNAIAERWIGGCRRELLDRTLVWNQAHLRRILRAYEVHHNQHRPHRSLDAAAPLKPLPEPVDLDRYRVRRQTHTACLINEYRLVALRERGFRHVQAQGIWFRRVTLQCRAGQLRAYDKFPSPLGFDQLGHRLDQGEMSERLGKVPEMLTG